MKKLKLFALTAVALLGVTTVANAATAMLAQDDFVVISIHFDLLFGVIFLLNLCNRLYLILKSQ